MVRKRRCQSAGCLLYSGILLIAAGIILLWIEHQFYHTMDHEGWLHESLFLPLGAFSLMSGLVIVLLWISLKLIHGINSRR